MITEDIPRHVGFVLARSNATLPWLNGRQYRGIDRPLPVPNSLKINPSAREKWNEYLEADDEGVLGEIA